MATSSRWKRFAFFERKNLSLPPSVVRDLIPPTANNRGGGGGGGNNRSRNTTSNDPRRIDATNPTSRKNGDDQYDEDGLSNDDENSGEYFSLVAASNVMLPPSLFSSEKGASVAAPSAASSLKVSGDSSKKNELGKDDDLVESDNIRGGGGAIRRGAGGDGASAMHAGLLALSTSSNGLTATNATGRGGGSERENNDNGLQLLFVSSRHTSHVHCVDVTIRCTPLNPLYSTTATSSNSTGVLPLTDRNDMSYPRDGDNFMGRHRGGGDSSNNNFTTSANAFASSSSSSHDRGRLQHGQPDGNINSSSNNAGAISTMNMEELDGWRGHYDPFGSCSGFDGVMKGGNTDRNVNTTSGAVVPSGATPSWPSSRRWPPPAPPAPR